ncbi:putative methyltransferase [Lachnellula cervina]|uniref:Putative methyltransferase n=1 Tax=Lachnellula cervina TaxID=1316786 RepID=A0A7D8Z4V6_9HELO|nr:putative methyltransferase [Lachnellula cervina]
MAAKQQDHWDSAAYQNSASFVPKLATKIIQWLDVQEGDDILDVGCGDGVLNLQIAQTLSKGTGKIHGIDSSESMIATAKKAASASANPSISHICTFQVLDATQLTTYPSLQTSSFDKVFSNAAMHWILRPEAQREAFFQGVRNALKPGGTFVFEMGGMGNVAEMRAALISVVSRRVGVERAREVDPWFFPDEVWMKGMLEETVGGWRVERLEREYRPTRADEGGVEGWVRLMGKQFFDAVQDRGEREECEREVGEVLKTVCESPGGGEWIGYVRLRAVVRKV